MAVLPALLGDRPDAAKATGGIYPPALVRLVLSQADNSEVRTGVIQRVVVNMIGLLVTGTPWVAGEAEEFPSKENGDQFVIALLRPDGEVRSIAFIPFGVPSVLSEVVEIGFIQDCEGYDSITERLGFAVTSGDPLVESNGPLAVGGQARGAAGAGLAALRWGGSWLGAWGSPWLRLRKDRGFLLSNRSGEPSSAR